MKKDIVDILCCPICKNPLELKIEDDDENEIITGSLSCSSCEKKYEIKNGIPDLRPIE